MSFLQAYASGFVLLHTVSTILIMRSSEDGESKFASLLNFALMLPIYAAALRIL